jgi:site-specific DNA-adenine methylase
MQASFSYPGGKATIRNTILEYIPQEGIKYIEPFAGRGNMFFSVKDNCSFEEWQLNDLATYKFLKALRDTDLRDLKLLDFESLRYKADQFDPIALILEPHITVMGKGYNHGHRYGKECNQSFIDNCYAAQDALKDVLITQISWEQLEYTKDCFVYFDPPYIDTSSLPYSNINHIELLEFLTSANFDWLLSGYYSDLYIGYLGKPIKTIEKRADMSNYNKNGLDYRQEYLWSNF